MRSWRAVRDGLPATMLCPPDDFPLARSDFKKTKQKKNCLQKQFCSLGSHSYSIVCSNAYDFMRSDSFMRLARRVNLFYTTASAEFWTMIGQTALTVAQLQIPGLY